MASSQIVAYRGIKELSGEQMSVLKQLKKCQMRQSDLHRKLEMPKSSLSVILGLFEQGRLVSTKKSGKDRIVSLTIHGSRQIGSLKRTEKKLFLASL